MAISRTATTIVGFLRFRSSVTGSKYSGTVSSAGTVASLSYIEVAGTPFEENVVVSGTCAGDCRFTDGSGGRNTLEDTTLNARQNITGGIVYHNITDDLYDNGSGWYDNNNARVSANAFRTAGGASGNCTADYEVFGFNPVPTDYTVVFDSNILVMTSGDAAGEIVKCQVTQDNRIWTSAFETLPSNGDTFIIPYSPADIVYANPVHTFDTFVDPGGALNNGTWTKVSATGGSGNGAMLVDVTIAGGTITNVVEHVPTGTLSIQESSGYLNNDTLTLSDLALQGGGGDDTGTCDVLWPPAGKIHYQDKARRIAHVEVTDDTGWSSSCNWGWAGYQVGFCNRNIRGTQFTAMHVPSTGTNFYAGIWKPLDEKPGVAAYMAGFRNCSQDNGAFAGQGTSKAYIRGSFDVNSGFGNFMSPREEAQYSRNTGAAVSLKNQFVNPSTYNSLGDIAQYGSFGTRNANFDGIHNFPFIGHNFIIDGWVNKCVGDCSPPAAGGFGSLISGNSSPIGEYFVDFIDCNLSLEADPKPGGGNRAYWGGQTDVGDGSIYMSKRFNIKVVDEDNNPVSGAIVRIKDRHGIKVSYVDTGSDINERVNTTETGIDVTLRENLAIGDILKVDREYMTITNVSGTGNGTMTVTRKSVYPGIHPNMAHETDLATYPSYDKNIYKVSDLTTDANGNVTEQIIQTAYWGLNAMQVENNGVTYTCILEHKAGDDDEEPGVGANWTTYWEVAGDQTFPWTDNDFYSPAYVSGADRHSVQEFSPFEIEAFKPGYEGSMVPVDVSLDSTGENVVVTLPRRRFIETKSRQGK